jgi:signal peptidase I
MTTRTWTKLVTAVLLTLGFFLLAPTALGGRATWVSTFGISMQPKIHAGDLAIARPQGSYHLGDIVAYRSPTLGGTVVLHRIVAQGPQGFTTKGDNNHWTDPDQPQGAEILGALWLHIPQGGHVLKLFNDPVLAPALIAVTGAVAGVIGTQVRRRRGSHRAPRSTRAGSKRRAEPWVKPLRAPGPEWAAGIALAAGVLAVLASTQPTMITTSRPIKVQDSTALSYTFALTNSAVYTAGIRTGDPVFLHLTSTVDTHLKATFGFDPGPVSGTVTPIGRISAANGWSREQALSAPQPLTMASTEANAPLDFAALLRAAHAAERQAGSGFGSFTVQAIYRVRVTGTSHRHPITITSAPTMSFTLTDDQAVIQASGTTAEPGAPLTGSNTTTVLVPVDQPATVVLLHWDVPITALRASSAALFLLALVLIAWTARGRDTSPQTILGHRLVHAHNIDLAGRTLVDVDTVDVLVKLCDLYSTVALHASTDSHDLFVVIADQTVYRLATPAVTKRVPSRVIHQPQPDQPVRH